MNARIIHLLTKNEDREVLVKIGKKTIPIAGVEFMDDYVVLIANSSDEIEC